MKDDKIIKINTCILSFNIPQTPPKIEKKGYTISKHTSQTHTDCTVLSNSCIKVTKNDELVCSKNSEDNIFIVFIELVFCLIHVGHGEYIDADDGSELFLVMKWKSYEDH